MTRFMILEPFTDWPPSRWATLGDSLLAYRQVDELSIIDEGRDFAVGRITLAKHLGISTRAPGWQAQPCVLELGGSLVAGLLLDEPSGFESGRIPLYLLCPCGDPACGALTARVRAENGTVLWSDFGTEVPYEKGLTQNPHQRRTGPFVFDAAEYRTTLAPYLG